MYDLQNSAHGWTLDGTAELPPTRRSCRYGRHSVWEGSESFCEFIGCPDEVENGGPVPPAVARGSWAWKHCRCNWCQLRRGGWHDQRGDRRVCFIPECQRRRAADEKARGRDRLRERQRDIAADFLVAYPELTDRQLSALVEQELPGKCARVRVREARELIAA